MDTSWIEMKDFPQMNSKTPEMRRIPGLIKKLRREYPTGTDWLNTPLEKRKLFCAEIQKNMHI